MFNDIITGAIVAQGEAAIAVALRTQNKKKRAMYISSIIPAFLGITEPVIFGINLRFVKPFICGLIGGACAGATASIMQLAGTGMVLLLSLVCFYIWIDYQLICSSILLV